MVTKIHSQRTKNRNLLHPSLAERANVVLSCSGSEDHGTALSKLSRPFPCKCFAIRQVQRGVIHCGD